MSKFIKLHPYGTDYAVFVNINKIFAFHHDIEFNGTWIRFGNKEDDMYMDYEPCNEDDSNICWVKETPGRIMKLINEVCDD
ncbi:hypothetical protein [Francisella marina]|uniref:Uncharacterized protein n=1 Tax=Francisella marina TaxID=2249302 RepID=A0ABX5ZHV5_9GAMM|nr:hypothetical protein [Francisella marina]QEO57596.1 hypothetical protein F0R74_06915 [Francisella marina]QEO58289.1 hypothetical protein F0R75_00325 [Francisella marina]